MINTKNTIIAALVVALIVGGLIYATKHKTNTTQFKPVTISSDEKKSLTDKVKDLQNHIKNFNDKTSYEDRFNKYSELSNAQLKLGKYEDALKTMDTIAPQNELNPKTWEQYGRIYWAMNNYDKAKENMKKSLDLFAGNVDLWKDYISLLNESGASKDTVNSTYALAVNATNNNVDILTGYARFFAQEGKKDSAIFYWQKAAELNPDKKAEFEAEIQKLK